MGDGTSSKLLYKQEAEKNPARPVRGTEENVKDCPEPPRMPSGEEAFSKHRT